jgi:hypothetical protein
MVVAAMALAAPRMASAQTLGTFSWQLQPCCNVVTVVVERVGDTYTLDGSDDQCGAERRAPVTGGASPNALGGVDLSLTEVGPFAIPLHTRVRLSLPGASGTWIDSRGDDGEFVLGGRSGGERRWAASGRARSGRTKCNGGCRVRVPLGR